jgi:hypothetical protein
MGKAPMSPCASNRKQSLFKLRQHGEVQGNIIHAPRCFITLAGATAYQAILPYPRQLTPHFASFPGTVTHEVFPSAATRKLKPSLLKATQNVFERKSSSLSRNKRKFLMLAPQLRRYVRPYNLTSRPAPSRHQTHQNERRQICTQNRSTRRERFGRHHGGWADSPAARAVWDGADEHLLAVYGFSIVDIVKDKRRSTSVESRDKLYKTDTWPCLTIQSTREETSRPYISLLISTFERRNTHSVTRQVSSSPPSSLKSFWSSRKRPHSRICAPRASSKRLRLRWSFSRRIFRSCFDRRRSSHLVSCRRRLLSMQRAVERDAQNRSNYAMCAVNPGRVSKTFNEPALKEVIEPISRRCNVLLEIVNFNVEVSLVLSANGFICSYFIVGPTIRLCRRTRRVTDSHERA